MAEKFVLKQGEVKPITLTVTDASGAVVDLSAATLLLGVKKEKTDTAYTFFHEDADFDKTQAASGIVKVGLTAEDTNQEVATYKGELQCSWDSPAVINKSVDFYLQIVGAINTNDSEITEATMGLEPYAVGDLLYGSSATTLAKLPAVAVGQVLVSGGVGVPPAWNAEPSLTSLTLTGGLLATQPAEEVPVKIFEVSPATEGVAKFGALVDSNLFDGSWNQYGVVGWNPGGAPRPESGILGVASWAMVFENRYWHPSDGVLTKEWYLNFNSADQSTIVYLRPIYVNILNDADSAGKQRAHIQFNIGDSVLFPGRFQIYAGPEPIGENIISEITMSELKSYRNFGLLSRVPGPYDGRMYMLLNDRYPNLAWYKGSTIMANLNTDVLYGDFYFNVTRKLYWRNLSGNVRLSLDLSKGVLNLAVLTAAPSSPSTGDIAYADRITWDPLSKGSGGSYLVHYNGSAWVGINEQ